MVKSLAGFWDFLGGIVVRIQCFQGLGSIPGWGLKDSASHIAQKKRKEKKLPSQSLHSLSVSFSTSTQASLQSSSVFSDLGQWVLAHPVSTFVHSCYSSSESSRAHLASWPPDLPLLGSYVPPPEAGLTTPLLCTHCAKYSPRLCWLSCSLTMSSLRVGTISCFYILASNIEVEVFIQRVKRGFFIASKVVTMRSSLFFYRLGWFCHVQQKP